MTTEEKISRVAQVENLAKEKNVSLGAAAEELGMTRGGYYDMKHSIKEHGPKMRRKRTDYTQVDALVAKGMGVTAACKEMKASIGGFNYWKKKQIKEAKIWQIPAARVVTKTEETPCEFMLGFLKRYPNISNADVGRLIRLV